MFKRLENCYNTADFRALAKQNIPGPIFHYIDGAADDEKTYFHNTKAFDKCDLVPNVLNPVTNIDTSVEILGKKIDLPIFLSPTALQRLFHHEGERAVGEAAEEFNTYFGISSLATIGIEEIGKKFNCPKMFQLYVHKDKSLNEDMLQKCVEYNFDSLAITVDTIVGGNRERDLRTGFTSPPRLTMGSMLSFALSPKWSMNYLVREKFSLPQLESHLSEGTKIAMSVGDYFTKMLDQELSWKKIEDIKKNWKKPLCLKGIMSVEDAKKAIDVGASAIMISNHGGRQLDGSRSPFDQLEEIVNAVSGKIEIICDGGIR
ncbi:MAG: alpha-hydroxy acid oxidase, partial [Alphaproteobacteria bacterium]